MVGSTPAIDLLRSEYTMEIELKLLIHSENIDAFRAHPLLAEHALAEPRERRMTGTYFDTPDLHIKRSGAGLRVRQVGGNWVQTMKGGGGVAGGLHQRHEWESVIAGPMPDLPVLRELVEQDSPWGEVIHSARVEDRLIPIFTTAVTRTTWDLKLPQGIEIECVLDQGILAHNDQTEQVSEIELELKSGEPRDLIDFALKLQQDVPLCISNRSKAERGYALYAPPQRRAVKAGRLELSKDMTVEEAFVAVTKHCMAHIQANEWPSDEAGDPDRLHQMRVGLRRLRSAAQLFDDSIPFPVDLLEEIRWFAATLGEARDWDVLAASTLPGVTDFMPVDIKVAAITSAALAQAQDKHAAASAAIHSTRYTRLVLRFHAWLLDAGWRNAIPEAGQHCLAVPIKKVAGKMLADAHNKLSRRGRHLKRADADMRHRVRIAAKRARYATELLESLYASKRTRAYLKKLVELQEKLGWQNDAAVANELLRHLQKHNRGVANDIAFVRGYLAARLASDTSGILKRWKTFKRLEPPYAG
jgi:triphosphatase